MNKKITDSRKIGYADFNSLIFEKTIRIPTRRTPGLITGENIVLIDTSNDDVYDAIVLNVFEKGAIVEFDWNTKRSLEE